MIPLYGRARFISRSNTFYAVMRTKEQGYAVLSKGNKEPRMLFAVYECHDSIHISQRATFARRPDTQTRATDMVRHAPAILGRSNGSEGKGLLQPAQQIAHRSE
jgi:hypothetical protein